MKYFYLDLETTGLDPQKSAIHQLAAIIEIDGEIIERIDLRIRPFAGAIITQEALDTGKVTLAQIQAYPPESNAYKYLLGKLSTHVDKFNKQDKYHIVGYNCQGFDGQFLRELFIRMGDKYYGSWFWPNTLDVMILAGEHLKHTRHEMPNFQLTTVTAKLLTGVDVKEAHDAAVDIEWTRYIYHKVTTP